MNQLATAGMKQDHRGRVYWTAIQLEGMVFPSSCLLASLQCFLSAEPSQLAKEKCGLQSAQPIVELAIEGWVVAQRQELKYWHMIQT